MSPRITPVMDMSIMNGNLGSNLNVPGNLSLNNQGYGSGDVNITINGYNQDPTTLAKQVEQIIVRRIQS